MKSDSARAGRLAAALQLDGDAAGVRRECATAKGLLTNPAETAEYEPVCAGGK